MPLLVRPALAACSFRSLVELLPEVAAAELEAPGVTDPHRP